MTGGFWRSLGEEAGDVGSWILDLGSWILDVGCWMLDFSNGTMSYKTLEVWQMAREIVIDIHRMSLEKLPKFEMYEEGSQIRRSSESVRSNIVEGYGRRRHKGDYLKFLDYAFASHLETTDHLETLFETGSLTDQQLYDSLAKRLDTLGRKLNNFIQGVEKHHNT
jgi:four helix bundle protein